MFCNQCEQTAKGIACTKRGVCGKTQDVDILQDVLIYTLQGLSSVSQLFDEDEKKGLGMFMCEALFSTLTNVNFDPEDIMEYIFRAEEERDKLKEKAKRSGLKTPENPSLDFKPPKNLDSLIEAGKKVEPRPETADDMDIFSLKLTTIYALKGVAAYSYHAAKLGKEDSSIYSFMEKALSSLEKDDLSLSDWLGITLKTGEINLRAMELLDEANTETYGNPVPTKVPLKPRKGKAILVSGHDLQDLHHLLERIQDEEIWVYTHGEMLPAHGYPKLKSFDNLYGHYGTAWHNQTREFSGFPGPIVMTTNCLVPPKESYKDRVFTMGPVGYPGLKHIKGSNFQPVIDMANSMDGFGAVRGNEKYVTTGFARDAVLSLADNIINAVNAGKIRHFFLVGGCDGARPERSYYTRFVELTPKDTVVLTLGCGKFRFFDMDLGDIDGIPRLLDLGQCNDAYSAIKIALALSKALNKDINELPLSLNVSWYEQKAVAILLTLLHLGVKNIRLGPTMPAFFSQNVARLLQGNYNIMPIKTPEEDIETCLKK